MLAWALPVILQFEISDASYSILFATHCNLPLLSLHFTIWDVQCKLFHTIYHTLQLNVTQLANHSLDFNFVSIKLLENIDAPSKINHSIFLGLGKLSSNDQLPLFCRIFFLKARLHVQFSEHGKGQLILKCPFGLFKSTKKQPNVTSIYCSYNCVWPTDHSFCDRI